MAIVPLMHTQLVPPYIKNSIKRTCLLELGLSILSHRVTTVTAPAGYGKSVWVSSLLKEPGWPLTAWLSLDSHDIKPSFLLYHLIHAIKKVLPQFGSLSLRTMNSLEDAGRDWLVAVSTLIEELTGENEIVLVLDDFHLIDKSAAVCSILEHLIHWLPAGTHLVLISRNNIPLNLYRERLSEELLEIQGDQLLFSIDETRELLLLLDLELMENDVTKLHSCAEGWPVGLRMLAILLKQSGNLQKTLSALKQKNADLYTYLNNEILRFLPNELHFFLLDSSLLPYLEPELCNTALQCSNSDVRIKQLHSHGILSRTESETITWRLHHLMGEFLEQKVKQLRPPDYIIKVRRRAAAFLEKKGDIDRALEQLIACSDWSILASLINKHGDKYFLQSGRLDALNFWINCLPKEVVSSDHWLMYFKGMSILHIYPEEALDTLSYAADYAGEREDIKCQLRSLLAMIAVYTFANNVKKVKETARRIPVTAALLQNSWSRGVVLVAALTRAAYEDNLQQGVWLSWLAGKTKLDPESNMAYLMFSCMIQYRLGNLSTARELIEKALADPYVQENERWIGTSYTIYAVICTLAGDQKKLIKICKELLRLGQKYNAPHQIGNAYRRLGRLHLEEGNLAKARKELELSRNAFIQANNIFYAYVIDLDLILLRIKAGENARDLLTNTQYVLDRLKTIPGGQGLDDYALSVAGIIAMEAGQLELAQQRFEKVSQICKHKGSRQVLAGTQFLLARLYFLKGDDVTADSYLRKALGSAESEKWEYFWDWHPETIYTLCRRALFKKISPKWATHILLRWFPQRTCKEASDLLIYPDENVQNCITMLIQDMVQKTDVPVVHVNCLGGFRVFVNGVEITPSHWKTKKAENLFKFLILDRRHHPKDKIIEALWPEADLGSGDANLRMALTHVRKALGLNDNNYESIILKRGMIYLNPKLLIYTDYELFSSKAQSILQDANIDNPVTVCLLEQAAQLYRENLLPQNIYDDWTSNLRTELHHLYLQVLLKLIESNRQQLKLSPAIQACRRYLALEPTDESVCRTAMELLCKCGQKQQALSLYKEFSAFLTQEYDTAPTVETKNLYNKICSM